MKNIRLQRESGAVSIFMVIFAMLLITIITVSFLRLMIADQRQASDSDLAQSAYDSAQAGVEDGKRALIRYQQICGTTPAACAALKTVMTSDDCNVAVSAGGIATREASGEVLVQQVSGIDGPLNQAYTCTTIDLDTEEYIDELGDGESTVIPLFGTEDFNSVTIRWFERRDLDETNVAGVVDVAGPAPQGFVQQDNWGDEMPPVMRAQLIQFGSNFTLDQFNYTSDGQSNANTVFLYPLRGGASTGDFLGLDNRATSPGGNPAAASALTPRTVDCRTSIATGSPYACEMTLSLPEPMGGGTDRTAFLRLTAHYNATHFQVVLSNGDPTVGIVRFDGVQPVIDSTGRANDIFRRIRTSVNLYNPDFSYPDATIDVTQGFCKTFATSSSPSTYNSTNECD